MTTIEKGFLGLGAVLLAVAAYAALPRPAISADPPKAKAESRILTCLPEELDDNRPLPSEGRIKAIFACLGFARWMTGPEDPITPNSKGEFETTADFQARTTFKQPARYAILFGRDLDNSELLKYDADREAFRVIAPSEEVFTKDAFGKERYRGIVIERETLHSTMVDRKTPLREGRRGIAYREAPGESTDEADQSVPRIVDFWVPIPRAEAVLARGHLRVLIVAESYVGTELLKLDSFLFTPRHEPYGSGEWLRVSRPVQLWVVDDRTGGAVFKQTLAK